MQFSYSWPLMNPYEYFLCLACFSSVFDERTNCELGQNHPKVNKGMDSLIAERFCNKWDAWIILIGIDIWGGTKLNRLKDKVNEWKEIKKFIIWIDSILFLP